MLNFSEGCERTLLVARGTRLRVLDKIKRLDHSIDDWEDLVPLTISASEDELRLEGLDYVNVLKAAHEILKPRRYFEIGVFSGDTLKLSRCPSVGVDPQLRLEEDFVSRRDTQLFEQTSDEFFATHEPQNLLGGLVDLAFLDGMHQFDYLLRDFMGCERNCASTSTIFMHDCLPGHSFMTRAHANVMDVGPPDFPGWTGDVWKIVPVLRRYRPDLTITCLDAKPTGLVVVGNPDRNSKVLCDKYSEIIQHWSGIGLSDWGLRRMVEEAQVVDAAKWLQSIAYAGLFGRVKRMFRRQAGVW